MKFNDPKILKIYLIFFKENYLKELSFHCKYHNTPPLKIIKKFQTITDDIRNFSISIFIEYKYY